MRRDLGAELTLIVLALIACVGWSRAAEPLSSDPSFFPIAVWLQSPGKAPQYKAAGINTYVGLWRGPTEEQERTSETARAAAQSIVNKCSRPVDSLSVPG